MWSDVTESEHSCAVADDGDGVPFACQLINLFGILYDVFSWSGDSGAVPYVEVVKVFDSVFWCYGYLAFVV